MKTRAYFTATPPGLLEPSLSGGLVKFEWFKVCPGVYLVLVFYYAEK